MARSAFPLASRVPGPRRAVRMVDPSLGVEDQSGASATGLPWLRGLPVPDARRADLVLRAWPVDRHLGACRLVARNARQSRFPVSRRPGPPASRKPGTTVWIGFLAAAAGHGNQSSQCERAARSAADTRRPAAGGAAPAATTATRHLSRLHSAAVRAPPVASESGSRSLRLRDLVRTGALRGPLGV